MSKKAEQEAAAKEAQAKEDAAARDARETPEEMTARLKAAADAAGKAGHPAEPTASGAPVPAGGVTWPTDSAKPLPPAVADADRAKLEGDAPKGEGQ